MIVMMNLADVSIFLPRCAVSEDHLQHLFEIGFSATSFASMLGVSVRTIRRRMDDIGLLVLYFTRQ